MNVPASTYLQMLLDEAAARHKHLCPRQVLGVRMGLFGLRQLKLVDDVYLPRYENSRKRLLTIVETDGCGADGIAVATNCYVGQRTLRVLDYGKMAATLIDTRQYRGSNDRRQLLSGWRVRPAAAARELAQSCAPSAPSRWHAYLISYQMIPDEELLDISQVTLNQTLSEILSRPGVRVNCVACGEEIINEREVTVDGRTLCRSCAGDGYYA